MKINRLTACFCLVFVFQIGVVQPAKATSIKIVVPTESCLSASSSFVRVNQPTTEKETKFFRPCVNHSFRREKRPVGNVWGSMNLFYESPRFNFKEVFHRVILG